MAVSQLAAPLLGQDIFQGLSPLQVTEIARRAEKVMFRAGQPLIEAGEIGDAAVLIVAGEAVRTLGPCMSSSEEVVEEGSLVGELSMFIDRAHTSTVVARTDVRALRITREDLLAQMYEDPVLAEHMAGKISSRLDGFIRELQAVENILDDRESPSPDTPNLPHAARLSALSLTPDQVRH